ncbi:c-type cytochrome biogenesis protein CcmI [Halorhodospira abdelmalekii]|uniref:c-type cytochrome biogenesis protein CcmI n=1 Tax=Halorhodospira abdelmalekii TaxID=421629 RepID=UPI00190407BA|nr:c-type cytochrome biogenesis protein CcmI [Halorhodospira abdelmalekii]MBK1734762.1 c-type cytochrome biogenesis protein CcmI [Halorhodospira abdelmalekii]
MVGSLIAMVLVLCLMALGFVLFPLIRDVAARAKQQSRREVNAAIHYDRVSELEQDLENGTLSREQFDQAMQDLERDLIQSGAIDPDEARSGDGVARGHRGAVIAAAVGSCIAVPALALSVYAVVGDPDGAIDNAKRSQQQMAQQQQQPQQPHADDDQQLLAAAQQLRQRLEADPEDTEGWALYARTMVFLQELEEARDAYERAVELDGRQDANLLSEYADVLAGTKGSLEGRPEALIAEVLEIDPENVRGLWLAGTAAYNREDYDTAEEYWQRLLGVVPADSQVAREIQANIEHLASQRGE